jgi:transcriptional regulator with XRE-family HTH domain
MSPATNQTFGERLRELREARGLGIRELSRKSGLSLSHLHYLERDARRPGDETLKKLARHLGVSTQDLVAERDDTRLQTELTLLLKEAGPLSAAERRQLLQIAEEALAESDEA